MGDKTKKVDLFGEERGGNEGTKEAKFTGSREKGPVLNG